MQFRWRITLSALVLLAAPHGPAAAQTEAPRAQLKAAVEQLGQIKTRWNANKPRLKACRQEAAAQGHSGDDRWFFIEDCMGRSN